MLTQVDVAFDVTRSKYINTLADILPTFSNAFSWMKKKHFDEKNLIDGGKLTMKQYWFE